MKKRIFAVMMITVLAAALMTACGKKEEAKPAETAQETQVAGGWTAVQSPEAALTDEDQAMFDAAASQYDKGEIKAVALLATQVVSGTNYCFLTEIANGDNTTYSVTVIYKDLQGEASLTSVTEIPIAADSYGEPMEQGLAGGWTIAENTYACPSRVDAEILDKAQHEYTGASFELVASLGTQVVAGKNYCYLCKSTIVTANPFDKLSVVTVYEDLDGKAQITNVVDFNITEYNK